MSAILFILDIAKLVFLVDLLPNNDLYSSKVFNKTVILALVSNL